MLVLLVPLSQMVGQTRVDAKLGEYDKTDHGGILGGSKPVVINPTNVNQLDDNYARLKASPGIALTLGAYTSYIELKFPKTLEANQTSYVRLQPDGKLLEGLLGGSLGELLTGVLGAVLTGNQEFDIAVGLGTSTVLNGSSTLAFKADNGVINVVKDKNNYYYLAITPNKAYDRIELINRTGSVLGLGVVKNLDVFHAFTYDDKGEDCGKPSFTSFDGAGLNLDVLSTTDPMLNHAIDGDVNTFSTLNKGSLLSLKVGGSMSQIFYFPTTSNEQSSVNIKLAVGSTGVLDLNLLGGVEVLAYNGKSTVPVYQKSLSGGLIADLNLLNLIKEGKTVDLIVAPQKSFDRLEVRLKAPVGVDLLGSSVRIYDVERYDGVTCKNPLIKIPDATDQPFEVASCSTSLGVFDNVDFPYNAIDGNNETYATLIANNGSLLVSAPQSGRIEMRYNAPLVANKTSYIRIDADKGMLNALLGGTLGKLVADLGGLVLGNHIFTVEAYNTAGTSVLKRSSSNGFDGDAIGAVKLVQDNIGRYYLAVTPDKAYQSIVVSNSVGSLLPTGEIRTLNVYNMCTEIGTDLCFPAQFTSYDQKGLSLGVADLAKAGVNNPYFAIDTNTSNYSEISNGLLSVGGLVKQTIYFNQPSKVGDELKVRLQLDPKSLLSVDLLGGYKVVTYLGGKQQESFTLQQGLINSLNLLDLFKSGGVQTLTFDTKQVFDRVDIQVSTVLTASVTPAIRLYDVKRVSSTCPEKATLPPFIKPVCAAIVLSASNADDIDNIFSENFDDYATLNSGAGLLLGLGDQHTGHIELGYEKTIKAGTTSYIRFDYDKAILDKLVSGSLGNLVSGLVDGLLLGNHYFTVDVKDAAGVSVLQGSSKGKDVSFKNQGDIRIVSDKDGRTYLAITPSVDYKSVRITDKTNALLGLLTKPNTMNIYSMCYESDTNSCVPSFATSFEYTGLSLDVTGLSGAGVTYPERAIDDNTTHYSEISLGTVNIAGSVRQYIYFNSVAKAGEETLIKFRTQGGQVNLDLIGALEIKAYKGDKEVDAVSSTNGLINGINVLDLLTNNKMVELPFKPRADYDRVSIGMKSLVGVNVGASLHLYDVVRTCKIVNPNQSLVAWKSYKVNNDATIKTVKGGETVEYTIHVRNESTTPIADFIVKDKMPKGVKLKSQVGGVVNTDEVVFIHKGALAPGAIATFTFTVDVATDLTGLVEIKNIAYVGEAGQEVGKEVFYPSYPPVDNTNPVQPDGTKAPGTVIKVESSCSLVTAVITSNVIDGSICEGTELVLDSNIIADTYQWYLDGVAITTGDPTNKLGTEKTLKTSTPGNYTVVYTTGKCVSDVLDSFIVTQKESPEFVIEGGQRINAIISNVTNSVTVNLPNVASKQAFTYTWYDVNGAEVKTKALSFNTPGVYTYTVVVNYNGCEAVEALIITVYDSNACPPKIERTYATKQDWSSIITGGVWKAENAVSPKRDEYSTLTTGLGLLGIGTVWQNLEFDEVVPAGTPLTIKLGKEYSGLALAGGLSVKAIGENGKAIGPLKSVQGGLLDLLSGDNVVEYTFIPTSGGKAVPYKGVTVSQGALVSVAQNAKLYGAYYTKTVDVYSNEFCDAVAENANPTIADVLHGVQDIGLGVASATASVVNPWHAVDNNPDTYAFVSRGVAVLNAATLTVIFKQQAMPSDRAFIEIAGDANNLLSLELLGGYTIQRYLGDKPVGDKIDSGSKFLGLKLLGLGAKNKYRIMMSSFPEPYDRIKLWYGNVVGVLGEGTKVYNVNLLPEVHVGIDVDTEHLDLCTSGVISLDPEGKDICTTYQIYTKEIGGTTLLDLGNNQFRIPNTLEEIEIEETIGGKKVTTKYNVIYVQAFRNGCAVGARVQVKVKLKNCSVKSNLNITHKIK